jgi:hypothetical protein
VVAFCRVSKVRRQKRDLLAVKCTVTKFRVISAIDVVDGARSRHRGAIE